MSNKLEGMVFIIVVSCAACSPEEEAATITRDATVSDAAATAMVDDARIANIETAEPGAWLTYGRNYEEQRFSPLSGINRETVGDLGIAWYIDFNTYHPFEGTPLVIDGVLYFSTPFNIVYAVDAGTGAELWRYDPQVPPTTRRRACCGANARGLAAYEGNIYTPTLDGRLIALDAATGTPLWEVDTVIDHSRQYTITGAPRAARGKVFIGNGGAEFGVRGYVTAYDAVTGEQAWRFFTVPGNPAEPFEHPEMALAAQTWSGEWWEFGGGGTVWNSVVYDPDFNNVYLGVGNGSPWTRAIRSPGGGDNLFLASIIALDADTGRMKWYYQTTPGDNWDYTAVQDMMLADMRIRGQDRKVLMQAPKNGFFYVIDRADGTLLRAHPFATVTWATHVDLETGRPVENRDTEYLEEPRWVLPGPWGAHNWQAMSFDANRRLVYFGSHDIPFLYAMPEEYLNSGTYEQRERLFNLGVEMGRLERMMSEQEDPPEATGFLNAFDPVTGEKKWVVEQEFPWNGGVLATAGDLVFQGTQTGNLVAFNSDTGDILWEENLYSSIVAPPITYEHEGKQFIAILTGAGGGDRDSADDLYGSTGRLVTFTLGGNLELPAPVERDRSYPEPPPLTASAEDIDRGEVLFAEICNVCHLPGPVGGYGGIPDLRRMTKETHEQFSAIVLGGSKRDLGMDSFADVLNAEDTERIRQYLISRTMEAREAMAETQPAMPFPREVIDLGALVTEDLPERVWGQASLRDRGWYEKQNVFDVMVVEQELPGGTVSVSNSYYTFFNHGGPHVDAPNHIGLPGGLDSFPVDAFVGPVKVFDVSHFDPGRTIDTAYFLDKNIGAGDIVLLYTGYMPPQNETDYPSNVTITREAALYLAGIPVKAIGTDAHSLNTYDDDKPIAADTALGRAAPVHEAFLSQRIPIYEQLFNVNQLLEQENMFFVGAPLNVEDGDGMMVRPVVFVY